MDFLLNKKKCYVPLRRILSSHDFKSVVYLKQERKNHKNTHILNVVQENTLRIDYIKVES